MQKSSSIFLSVVFILLTTVSCFFIPIILNYDNTTITSSKINVSENTYKLNDTSFLWPVPGYNKISGGFGKRIAPVSGASTNHLGIDIPAPSGTNIISISNGRVIFTGWRWG